MSINSVPEYNTILFTDVFPDVETFLNGDDDETTVETILGYTTSPFPQIISTTNATILYYLLYARFGNNPIANSDVNQFMIKLWSIVYQYGPTWEKRLEIQSTLRGLSETQLMEGAKQIYNHAFNPSTAPTTAALEELSYINDQNTTNFKRGKLEAYDTLWNMLKVDVTEEFIDRFKKLFKIFVLPEQTLLYQTTYEED